MGSDLVRILALTLASPVTLSKLLHFSGSVSSSVNGDITSAPSPPEVRCEDEGADALSAGLGSISSQ